MQSAPTGRRRPATLPAGRPPGPCLTMNKQYLQLAALARHGNAHVAFPRARNPNDNRCPLVLPLKSAAQPPSPKGRQALAAMAAPRARPWLTPPYLPVCVRCACILRSRKPPATRTARNQQPSSLDFRSFPARRLLVQPPQRCSQRRLPHELLPIAAQYHIQQRPRLPGQAVPVPRGLAAVRRGHLHTPATARWVSHTAAASSAVM